MKKATQRPSIQDRYAEQVRRDRRAAALERREDDYRPALNALYIK
jgi:hypothetical protein